MTMPFNGLTPAQAERLAMLAEEAGEVIQVVGKILRHGYANHHPDAPHITNAELFARELIDFAAVADVIRAKDRLFVYDTKGLDATWRKKLRYTHHQGEVE